MKTCGTCNEKNADDVTLCGGCGVELGGLKRPQDLRTMQDTPKPKVKRGPRKK